MAGSLSIDRQQAASRINRQPQTTYLSVVVGDRSSKTVTDAAIFCAKISFILQNLKHTLIKFIFGELWDSGLS